MNSVPVSTVQGSQIEQVTSAQVNLIWRPVWSMNIGVEYMCDGNLLPDSLLFNRGGISPNCFADGKFSEAGWTRRGAGA